MDAKEIEDRRTTLKKLLRDYRVAVGDTDKAIREWAKAMAAENLARADGFLHMLDHPADDLNEARYDAMEATARVHRMEAAEKMREAAQREKEKRREMDKAVTSFAEGAVKGGHLDGLING